MRGIFRAIHGAALGASLLACSIRAGVAAGSAAATESKATEARHPGRLFVIADSVLLGNKDGFNASFADWDGINVRGFPGIFTEKGAEIAGIYADEVDDVAIVGLGYNYPYWDPPRFDRSIDLTMKTLTDAGAKHVVWVTMREVRQDEIGPASWELIKVIAPYYPEANGHLRDAQKRWPQLVIADWAALAHQRNVTYDAIHLNTRGQSLMGALIRDTVDGIGGAAAGGEMELAVRSTPGVPADATAVAVNLTVLNASQETFASVYPCGQPRPATSSVNVRPGQVVANLAISAIGANGRVCVSVADGSHLAVDLFGVFTGSAFTPVGPNRMADSRSTGPRVEPATPLRVPMPAGVTGTALVNVTALGATDAGYATAYPCGTSVPPTSTVNVVPGETAAAFTAVTVDATRLLCVSVSTPMHIIVDITGSLSVGFDTSGAPRRVVDTRQTASAPSGLRPLAGGDGAIRLLTVTADRSEPGFVTITSCATPERNVSNLNSRGDTAVANAAFAPASDACIFTNQPTHVIVDELGRFTPLAGFALVTPRRLLDTRDRGVYRG
jgi:hypothetical protein